MTDTHSSVEPAGTTHVTGSASPASTASADQAAARNNLIQRMEQAFAKVPHEIIAEIKWVWNDVKAHL